MTRIQFYHNAANPLSLACELAARACGSGKRVAIRVPDAATARELDRLLWTWDAQGFTPHVLADSPLAAETPVVIGRADAPNAWPHGEILFNLANELPPAFEDFRLLVEIIGQGEADKQHARERWRHYKQHGLPLQAFDAVRREAI